MSRRVAPAKRGEVWKTFIRDLVTRYISSEEFEKAFLIPPDYDSIFTKLFLESYAFVIGEKGAGDVKLGTAVYKLKSLVLEENYLIGLGSIILESIINAASARKPVQQIYTKYGEGMREIDGEPTNAFTSAKVLRLNAIVDVSGEDLTLDNILVVAMKGNRAADVGDTVMNFVEKSLPSGLRPIYSHLRQLAMSFDPDTASNKYEKFLRSLTKLLDELEKRKVAIPDSLNFLGSARYRGLSFPRFPGSLVAPPRFFRLQKSYSKIYTVSIFGEGWSEERNTLLKLLEARDDLEKLKKHPDPIIASKAEAAASSLNVFLTQSGLSKISKDDYKKLMSLKLFDDQKFLNKITEFLKEEGAIFVKKIPASRKGKSLNLTVRPLLRDQITVLRVFVLTRRTYEETREDILPRPWVTHCEDGEVDLLKDFILTLAANSNYLPQKIEIYTRAMDYREPKKGPFEFLRVLKATIDSGILYLLMKGDESVRKMFSNTPFAKISVGNVWLIPVIRLGTRNTHIHDFYYDILQGLNGWEFFESDENIRNSPVEKSTEDAVEFMLSFLRRRIDAKPGRLRARINVQALNFFEHKGITTAHPETDEEKMRAIDEWFGKTGVRYRFDDGNVLELRRIGKMKENYYMTDHMIILRAASWKPDTINRLVGRLSSHSWIYTAASLKNTSTAGYTIEIGKESRQEYILALLYQSRVWIKEEGGEYGTIRRYLYNIRITGHSPEGREVILFDEIFMDSRKGDVPDDNHKRVLKSIIQALLRKRADDIFRVDGIRRYLVVRVSNAPKSGEVHKKMMTEEEQEFREERTFSLEEFQQLLRKVPRKSYRILGYLRNATSTPLSALGNEPVIVYLKDVILQDGDPTKTLNLQCVLLYGKKGRGSGAGIAIYRHPAAIFSLYGDDVDVADGKDVHEIVRKMLSNIALKMSTMGDEKGKSSTTGLDRLFYMPYPDTTKMPLNPLLFIKGANRIRIMEAMI